MQLRVDNSHNQDHDEKKNPNHSFKERLLTSMPKFPPEIFFDLLAASICVGMTKLLPHNSCSTSLKLTEIQPLVG